MDGKVVAVTGASSGSGLGISRRFAEAGATVVMIARDRVRLEAAAATLGPRAVPVVADVTDPASVAAAFEEVASSLGRLDVLINNAAIYRPCRVEHLTDEDIARQVGTNLLGPLHTARAAIPLLRAAGGGDIINTSSESTLHPFPMLSLYVATKAGLEAFSEVLAQELRDDDIRVTVLVQGTAAGAGNGTSDWAWDPEHAAEALALWRERGLLSQVQGRHGGQDVEAIGDVHLFIVTRPRTQKLQRVHCQSF